MKAVFAPILAAVMLSACTIIDVPAVSGGPPRALTPGVADTLRVRHIRADAADWVYLDYEESRGRSPTVEQQNDPAYLHVPDHLMRMEFDSTVEEEVAEELRYCATGDRPVDVSVLITSMQSDPRLRSLIDGNGSDDLAAIVELLEPDTGEVLGRYAVQVGARSGNFLERVLGDRLMNTAEMLGRDLCLQAFGRNPRPPRLSNATR